MDDLVVTDPGTGIGFSMVWVRNIITAQQKKFGIWFRYKTNINTDLDFLADYKVNNNWERQRLTQVISVTNERRIEVEGSIYTLGDDSGIPCHIGASNCHATTSHVTSDPAKIELSVSIISNY